MTEVATYIVSGMTCGHCAAAVTEELEKIDGVREIDVVLDGGLVTVHADGPLEIDAVRDAIDEAGYELIG